MSNTADDLGGIDPAVYARRWRILPVLCLSLSIVMVANGSLNIALPSLARELDASTSSLQWMVDVYALVFAGLLFTAGTIGDRYGRKGTLQGGLLLFLVGTAVAAGADSAGVVIGARALMGVAAALIMPSTLSILANVFPPHERGRAIAIWAGVAAGGAALGPSITGLLLEHLWWGSVFLVNVPLVVTALVLGVRVLPRSRDPQAGRFDVAGALLSMVGIGSLVYAIIEAPGHGWTSAQTFLSFTVAAVFITLFVLREHTARGTDARPPVVPRPTVLGGIGRHRDVLLRDVRDVLPRDPVHAARARPLGAVRRGLAAAGVDHAGCGLPAGSEAGRPVRDRPCGGQRAMVVAFGLVLMSRLGTDSSIVMVVGAFVPMAGGMAITMTPLTTMIMAAVPRGNAGIGSAMNDTTRELGGALGVAVLGSLVNTRYTSRTGPLPRRPAGRRRAGRRVGSGRRAGVGRHACPVPRAEGWPTPPGPPTSTACPSPRSSPPASSLAAAVTAYVLLPDEAVAPAAPEDELADLEELEAA